MVISFVVNSLSETKILEEIRNLLKEAIEPLEQKIDNLNNGFQELKHLVDFVNEKYDDVLVELKQVRTAELNAT